MSKRMVLVVGLLLVIVSAVLFGNQNDDYQKTVSSDYYTDKTQFNFTSKKNQVNNQIDQKFDFKNNTDTNKSVQPNLKFSSEKKNSEIKNEINSSKSENSVLIPTLISIGLLILVLVLTNIRRNNGKTR